MHLKYGKQRLIHAWLTLLIELEGCRVAVTPDTALKFNFTVSLMLIVHVTINGNKNVNLHDLAVVEMWAVRFN